MFQGFNINFEPEIPGSFSRDYFNSYKDKAEKSTFRIINSFKNWLHDYFDIEQGMSLDGSAIEAKFFPQVNADVFISHSHKDEEIASGLAGYLYEKYGLTSFIDSKVWKYVDTLITGLDDDYSLKRNERNHSVYDYENTLVTSTHGHMMLGNALLKMMDLCECFIFISTNNSNSLCNGSWFDYVRTNSAWLYFELSATRVLRKRTYAEYRGAEYFKVYKFETFSRIEESSIMPNVNYRIWKGHLINVTDYDFNDLDSKFCNMYSSDRIPYKKGYEKLAALDLLYQIKGVRKAYF